MIRCILVMFVITFSAILSTASVALGQSCPPAEQVHMRQVEHLLTSEARASQREAHGLGHLRLVDVQVAADSTDAAMCDWLRANLDFSAAKAGGVARVWAAFRVGDYYFVATRAVPEPGRVRLGWNPLVVLRPDRQLVVTFAM